MRDYVPTDGEELAWLGGFFSGEGTVHVARNGDGRGYLELSLTNTDKAAVLRFQRRFGGKVFRVRLTSPLSRKPQWCWRLNGKDATSAAVHALWWFLSDDKRAQAERAIDAVEANPPVDRGAAWRTRRERYGPSGRRAV